MQFLILMMESNELLDNEVIKKQMKDEKKRKDVSFINKEKKLD